MWEQTGTGPRVNIASVCGVKGGDILSGFSPVNIRKLLVASGNELARDSSFYIVHASGENSQVACMLSCFRVSS